MPDLHYHYYFSVNKLCETPEGKSKYIKNKAYFDSLNLKTCYPTSSKENCYYYCFITPAGPNRFKRVTKLGVVSQIYGYN
jgi:hypothetical protein